MSQQPQNPGHFSPSGPSQQPPNPTPGFPPNKAKKPWYKRWWAFVIAAVLVVGGINSMINSDDKSTTAEPAAATSAASSADPAEAAAKASAEAEASRSAAAEASASASAEAERSAAAKASADAAASAAAAAEAALKDPSTYSKISNRDWQLLEKDADSHAGEKYIIYGHITQADASTGTEMFRANSGGSKGDWYDYEVNTIVSADSSIVKGVVTDDLVRMYVTVVSSYSYDTQIGGSTTAVLVQAGIVENLGSSN